MTPFSSICLTLLILWHGHYAIQKTKLFCFKGRSSTFRLFSFRFIPTFIFFTRLLSAGYFYAFHYELYIMSYFNAADESLV